MLTAEVADPSGYGRIVRDARGGFERIVEHGDADRQERRIDEINCGIYCADPAELLRALKRVRPDNAQGEYYITDAVHGLLDRGRKVAAVCHADAQEILFTDERIKATWVNYSSPGGNSGEMRGYLVQPVGEGPFPAVLVMHENRGLNPYIQDVARRAAVAGFLALAPDGLAPIGGYPGNDDDGRAMQRSLDSQNIVCVKSH